MPARPLSICSSLFVRAQMPQPMQPTVHTEVTSLPVSLFEHFTTSMRSALKGTIVMMWRGHARTHAPQPVQRS